MTDQKPNANIVEIDGAYYPAHLKWIPSKGDLIKLHSRKDARTGYDAMHFYEVVSIVHNISDVDEGHQRTPGTQYVTVFVKASNDPSLRV